MTSSPYSLIAILTDEYSGEVIASKEMIAIVRFPPAVFGNGLGVFLFVKLKSPREAIYQKVRYYHLPEIEVEEEEFIGEFPCYLPYQHRS